jgi:hypothetical protein
MPSKYPKNRSAFEAGNRQAAEIILGDVAKYRGEEALLDQCARAVLRPSDRVADELKVRAGLGRTEGTTRQ